VIRLRKQVTLRRFAAVPFIVSVTFVVGSWAHAPWPVSALNAGLFVLPVFITGATLAQWLAFYIVAGIVVGLMAPPVVTRCGPRAVPGTTASQPLAPPVTKIPLTQ
jgi:hypothetical protein